MNGKLYGNKLYIAVFFAFMISAVIMVLAASLWDQGDDETMEKHGGEFTYLDEDVPFLGTDIPWTGTRANETTDPCIACHDLAGVLDVTTLDWKNSKHAQNNVSCINCHEAEPLDPDAEEHYDGYYITNVVSPADCAECHEHEAEEFEQSLHSYGALYYEYLFSNEKLPYLESQLEGGYLVVDGEEIDHAATLRGCQACHGTNMTGKSIDDFTVWPNNGIGRINPDGSRGSCSACHTRHSFSIAEARRPETCGQCHMGPDHPQIEMFMESKHGNIYSSEGDSWNWTADDWKAGVDYRAPTCAGCHMSSAPGLPATHDVGTRLSWELEGTVSKYTDNTANNLGVPMGNTSDPLTWEEKRDNMKTVCTQCHSTVWVDNYYEQADLAVELYGEQYLETKAIVDELYAEGLLTDTAFDEPIEFKIYEMWHHEGRRARMGAFMQAPDYVQWHGFYDLIHDKVEIEHMAEEIRSLEADDDDFTMLFVAANGPERKVYLKWNVSDPSDIDHYDLFWGTSLITDTSSLTPQATTTNDFYVAENLYPDKVYYFTIVAVNSSGDSSGIGFSSSMPVADISEEEVGEHEDEDDNDEMLQWLGIIGILILGVVSLLLSIARRKGGPDNPITASGKEPLEGENPEFGNER